MPSVHISLNVSDLERSIAFYRGLFGEPAKVRSDYAKFVGRDPEIHLALQPGLPHPPTAPTAPGSLSHLGIRVESSEEVRRRWAELERRGVVTEEEKREDCCYSLQDKFWITDPDGNRWEVYTVIRDSEGKPELPVLCCETPAAPAD